MSPDLNEYLEGGEEEYNGPESPGPWNLNGVDVLVNGESAGRADATETLAAVVTRFGRSKGIRYADVFSGTGPGATPLGASQGQDTLQELRVSVLAIVTKNQRASWQLQA